MLIFNCLMVVVVLRKALLQLVWNQKVHRKRWNLRQLRWWLWLGNQVLVLFKPRVSDHICILLRLLDVFLVASIGQLLLLFVEHLVDMGIFHFVVFVIEQIERAYLLISHFLTLLDQRMQAFLFHLLVVAQDAVLRLVRQLEVLQTWQIAIVSQTQVLVHHHVHFHLHLLH